MLRSRWPQGGRPGQAALHGHGEGLEALGGRTRRKTHHQLCPLCPMGLPSVPILADTSCVPTSGLNKLLFYGRLAEKVCSTQVDKPKPPGSHT